MTESVQEILKKIDQAQTHEDLEGWIWKASDFVAKSSFEVYNSGFPEIDAIVVSHEEGEKLKAALLKALERSSDPRFVGYILDCLIMSHDPVLKSLYVSYLDRYLRQLKDCNHVVYSTLNWLSRGGSSQSAIEVDNNIRQAHRYLGSLGIKQAW